MLLDNPKLDTFRTSAYDAGHPEYGVALELAKADIEEMEKRAAAAKGTPQFIMVEVENGEFDKFEDDTPWELLDIAVRRVARNVNALPLLEEDHLELVRRYLA